MSVLASLIIAWTTATLPAADVLSSSTPPAPSLPAAGSLWNIDVIQELPETVVKQPLLALKKAVTVTVTAWRKKIVHLAARGNT